MPVAWVTIWPAWGDAGDVAEELADDRQAPIVGRWKGKGEQTNGATWAIDLEVVAAKRGECAAIRYPSIGCGGTWRCTYGTNRMRLEASEAIGYGKTKCIDGGDVAVWLTRDGNRMRYAWRSLGEKAWGELERVD